MVLLRQPLPEAIQRRTDSLVIQICKSLAPENDDVHSGKVRLVPERFPHLTLDPVSLYRKFQIPFRKNKTDPGISQIVRGSQDQKISVRNLQLYVVEDFAVISRPQETMRFREIQSLHKANDRLRRQTSTAFGAATGNYLATVGSSHAGTETVNALTLQDAWLKRSFHGDYLTIRVLDIRELAGKLIAKTGAAF